MNAPHLSPYKRKAIFHHLICQQNHKQQQRGRKLKEKVIKNYGNDLSGETWVRRAAAGAMPGAFRALPVQLEGWEPGSARASQPFMGLLRVTVRQHLAGCFQQSARQNTLQTALMSQALICNVYKYFPKSNASA